MSLEPISKKLSSLINQEVIFNYKKIDKVNSSELNDIKNGSVMMLENIRFNKGEEINDEKFSKEISNLGDIYVNDAFSVSHRSHASVEGITKFIPSFYGLKLLRKLMLLKNNLK